jgi:hypothetical protein
MKFFLTFSVLLLSAVTGSWTLSERPLNNHECFVSVTSREMLENNDWIMPTFNGEPRLQKTPLSYWLVAGLAKITGKVDEFTTRLPSAVFAVCSAVAILYFVNHWLSFRTAVLSAAVWATSLGYIRYSHNARPEMVITFFIVLCFLISRFHHKSQETNCIYACVLDKLRISQPCQRTCPAAAGAGAAFFLCCRISPVETNTKTFACHRDIRFPVDGFALAFGNCFQAQLESDCMEK